MHTDGLPADLKGSWIWHPDELRDVEDYVFFRGEFTLAEVAPAAEIRLAANTSAQVYINGRHLTRAPSAAGNQAAYATIFDVAYCLQVGLNVIGILVHNTSLPRYAREKRPAGVWCQLVIDGQTMLVTDDSWQCLRGRCYQKNQPRVSPGDGFVEFLDLRRFPHRWTETDFAPGEEWLPARIAGSLDEFPCELLRQPDGEITSERYTLFNLVLSGEAGQEWAATHVSFQALAGQVPGLYCAETFIHTYEDRPETEFCFYSDDAYYLILNDQFVKVQGLREHRDWQAPEWNQPRSYQQEEIRSPGGTFKLVAGWNRLLLLQQAEANSPGATLVLPGLDSRVVKFLRGNNNFSLPGWNLYGPLRVPFADVSSSVSVEGHKPQPYYGHAPNDVAAWLTAYAFAVREETELPVEEVELGQGQFAVFEMEKYVRGCPEFVVTGKSGDVIDVLYGDFVGPDGALLPITDGNRQVHTLVLDEGRQEWRAFAPHGMGYLMLFVRQAQSGVQIEELGIRRVSYNFREPVIFNCADELLNQLWECGTNTLEATFDGCFLSTAGNQAGQILADTMIQALASLYVFGTPRWSEKALREFAAAQYETGEIPALAPGDFKVRLHDMALLWPIWLQRHVIHSGDQQLLHDMLPHLERLLVYFESITENGGLLLGNTTPPYGLPCLIDYDGNPNHKGISTSLNSLYCYALLQSEWLFRESGMTAEAQVCHDRASALAKALRQLVWDEARGLFADHWIDGQAAASCSLQTNVLALYSGLADSNRSERIFANIFIEHAPYRRLELDPTTDTPYFKFFVLDAAFTLNMRSWALDYMRYYWGKMISLGATTWWRRFSPEIEYDPKDAGYLCQGYGVSPNYFLITEILGVRPQSPGYNAIYFNPLLSAVEWCRGQLPTPRGTIQIYWGFKDTGELEIIIEASFPLEVVPLLDPAVVSAAIIHVSDDVTILWPSAGEGAAEPVTRGRTGTREIKTLAEEDSPAPPAEEAAEEAAEAEEAPPAEESVNVYGELPPPPKPEDD